LTLFLCEARWKELNLKQSRVWVRRGKNSLDIEQPKEG